MHDDAVMQAWLDGDLADDAHAQLQTHLRDPARARAFLRALHLDLALRSAARARQRREEIDPVAATTTRSHRRRTTALRLRRRLPARSTSRTLAVVALVALAATGAVLVMRARPVVAGHLVVDAGSVQVAGSALRAGGACELSAGTTVITPPDSWATLLLVDGSRIEICGGSRLTLVAGGGRDATRLLLTRGEVRADIRRQPIGRSLMIATTRTDTTVLGTRLTVFGGERERVEVDEGRVRVERQADRSAVDVAAGESIDVPVSGVLLVTRSTPTAPSGPAEEAPLSSGLRLWLCADRGIVPDAQGRVAQWRDQSGNAMDLNQANPSAQPRQVVNAFGRHAAVSFDAADDGMYCRSAWPEFRSYTVAVLLRPTAYRQWGQGIGCGWGRFDFHGDEAGALYTGVGHESASSVARFTPAELPARTLQLHTWQWFVVSYDHGSGCAEIHCDGVRIAGKSMPRPLPWRDFQIGRSDAPATQPNSFAADLHELLVYDRALTPGERAGLDQRFRTRLGRAP